MIDDVLSNEVYHQEISPALDPSSCPDNPTIGCAVLNFEYPYVNPVTGRIYEAGVPYEANRKKYIYDLDLDLCNTWPEVSIQDLDDPNKVEAWVSSSRSTTWIEQTGVTIRPEKEVQWVSGPTLSIDPISQKLCKVTGQLSGFAYQVIGDQTGLFSSPEYIPNNGIVDEFPRIIVSILVNDPYGALPDGGVLTETEEKVQNKDYLKIYPNPGKDRFTISYKINRSGNVKLNLKDLNGRIVHSFERSNQSTGDYSESIDLGHLPVGIYFCELQNNTATITRKLIKQ